VLFHVMQPVQLTNAAGCVCTLPTHLILQELERFYLVGMTKTNLGRRIWTGIQESAK
jgi:hypothetical protein